MIRLSRAVPFIALAATVVVGACRRNPPAETAPGPTPDEAAAAQRAAEQRRADSIANAERMRREEEARRAREAEEARRREEANRLAAVANVRSALTAIVYFDFDSSDLTESARSSLEAKIPAMNANPGVRIRIAGHADERGSDEYNMALGQRRAAAAKRYLTERGIDGGRIDIVSYGEERPAVAGSDESAWQQNRRAEFEIVAGGESLRAAN
jgi:peptidoglycan-associated lipoprotein